MIISRAHPPMATPEHPQPGSLTPRERLVLLVYPRRTRPLHSESASPALSSRGPRALVRPPTRVVSLAPTHFGGNCDCAFSQISNRASHQPSLHLSIAPAV